MRVEQTILTNLLHDEKFTRKVLPYLKAEYFEQAGDKAVFDAVARHFDKYQALPTKEAIAIALANNDKLTEAADKAAKQTLESLGDTKSADSYEWLLDNSEQFVQSQAIKIALQEAISIYSDTTGKKQKTAIPKILSDALAVSFDTSIGHDYLEDYALRYELYHSVANKIPFDLAMFNKVTKGGVSRKTMSLVMAPTGVGKTIFLCHFAASYLMAGYNVLYLSMEMAEAGDPSISERIDANCHDIAIDMLLKLPKDTFFAKAEALKKKTKGKLIIRQYPPATVGAQTFRNLLNEVKLKKGFVPDVIVVDYLNLCTSSTMKYTNTSVNSYMYIKNVAEELRAIAIEHDCVLWTATQTNRGGYKNSELELEDTSESIGLPMTVDFMMGLFQNDELHKMGQILCKQLKNRYRDERLDSKFVIGIDKAKMRLYDCEQTAQNELIDSLAEDNDPPFEPDLPLMDRTDFGRQDHDRNVRLPKAAKKRFQGFT